MEGRIIIIPDRTLLVRLPCPNLPAIPCLRTQSKISNVDGLPWTMVPTRSNSSVTRISPAWEIDL